MALADNADAMKRFALMSEPEQRQFIMKAHGIRSKEEMQALAESLTKQA